MKTKTLAILLFLLASVAVLSSCKKDIEPLTKEEAQAALTSNSAEYNQMISEYDNTQGNKIQDQLNGMNPPFGPSFKKSGQVFTTPNSFEKELIASDTKSANKFLTEDYGFENYVGTWTWVPASSSWQRTSTPTDKIIIRFPYPINNPTNNVIITYSDYTFKLIDGERVSTGLKGKMEYNSLVVWSWTYSANIVGWHDFSTLTSVTVGRFGLVEEFTYKMLSQTQWTYTSKNTATRDGATVYMNYLSHTITNFATGVTVAIDAKLIVLSIEFRIKINYNPAQIGEYTFDPNTVLQMSIYTTGGAKVGEFKFKKVSQAWVLYFVFNNGEEVLAETILHSDVFDEIMDWLDFFQGPN